jgi:N-acetylmuramoyl-L-alanine amidase
VLVETGYITNKEEEDYLNSESGQQEIAECITNALKSYVSWLEKGQTTALNNNKGTTISKEKTFAFLNNIDQQERKRKGIKTN